MPPGSTAGLTGAPQPFKKSWGRKLFLSYLPVALLPILLLGGSIGLFGQAWLSQLTLYQWQGLLIWLAIVVLFACLLAWLAARRIARPVRRLVHAMSSFASGNWEQRASLDSNDEIGQIGDLFNHMAQRLDENHHLLAIENVRQNSRDRFSLNQMAQIIASAAHREELLQNSLELIQREYSLVYGAIYLIEYPETASRHAPASFATLVCSSGSLERFQPPPMLGLQRVNLDLTPTMEWLVSKAIATNRPQLGAADAQGLVEAAVPIARRGLGGEPASGVLDLFALQGQSTGRAGAQPAGLDSASALGSRLAEPFSLRTVSELQMLADLLGVVIHAFGHQAVGAVGNPPTPDRQASRPLASALLPALSSPAGDTTVQRIARAEKAGQVMAVVMESLRQAPYTSLLLMRPSLVGTIGVHPDVAAIPEGRPGDPTPEPDGEARKMSIIEGRLAKSTAPLEIPTLPRPDLASVEQYFASRLASGEQDGNQPTGARKPGEPLILKNIPVLPVHLHDNPEGTLRSAASGPTDLPSGVPPELLTLAQAQGLPWAAYLPALRRGALNALLLLGPLPPSEMPDRATVWSASQDRRPLALPAPTSADLAPYSELLDLAIAALERIHAAEMMERKLAELETMRQISQAVSVAALLESDLAGLYALLHRQVENVMGEINSFAVVLYDQQSNTLRIPYMIEMGQELNIPSFPLGEGLSSIVIRTRQPLLLTENVVQRSLELGAKIHGEPAQSWLGVPLLFGGQAIGLIIVQDVTREHRFDEEDQRLLSTIGGQIAVAVHNARLLDTSRRQAQQERLINEISAQIRRSVDIQAVLKTAAEQLGQLVGARRAHIRISTNVSTPSDEERMPPGTARWVAPQQAAQGTLESLRTGKDDGAEGAAEP